MQFYSIAKNNWFIIALFFLPIPAWGWPELGSYEGLIHAGTINKAAVALIFFMNSLTLSRSSLSSAIGKIRFLLSVLAFCFVIAPLVAYGANIFLFAPMGFSKELLFGTLIVACLPTTIASCAIFTRIAGGDSAASLLSAITSNILGVFMTPLVLSVLAGLDGLSVEVSPQTVIFQLTYLIIIPLFAGQLVASRWSAHTYHQSFSFITQLLLLFMVYSAFCNTFVEVHHTAATWYQVLVLIIGMVLLNASYLSLSYIVGYIGKFPKEEKIALLFTAPQKTIAVGIPLGIALIESTQGSSTTHGLGLILLPLLIFNNIQWLAAGTLQTLISHYDDKAK